MKFQFQFEEIALCMEKHLIKKLHAHLNLNDCGIFFVPIKLFKTFLVQYLIVIVIILEIFIFYIKKISCEKSHKFSILFQSLNKKLKCNVLLSYLNRN